jgi:putative sterol carrier protein
MTELPVTIRDVMAAMPGTFRADKAAGVNARIQFNLKGEDGGTWTVAIADGQCAVQEGPAEAPNATLEASAADYLAIARGELDPTKAFMGGKLSLKGDMSLMMRFMQFFNRPGA